MKTIIKSMIWLVLVAATLVSCEDDALDPLTGVYTHPDVCDYTTLDSQTREKDGTLFVYTINLKDDASNTLNLELYSKEYALPSSDYTASATAANKTYSTVSSTCNGQVISSGTISVSEDGSGNYTMEGILYLADETVVRMTGSFSIVYEYIPTYTYSVETETPAYGGTYGTTEITGASKQKITVFSDGSEYAYFEITTEADATSLSGTYTITDPLGGINQAAPGSYFDFSWYGWGTTILEGGCYYIVNGEKMFIRGGDLTIVDEDGALAITGDELTILDLESHIAAGGSWATLEETYSIAMDEVKSVELLSAVIADLTAYNAGYSVDLTLSVGGASSSFDWSTYTTVYSGTGDLITLNFTMDADTLYTGSRTVVSATAATAGDCVAGYYNEYIYSDAGSKVISVTDGAASSAYINAGGTVDVEYDSETGDYYIAVDVTTSSGSVTTYYSGPITFTHVAY